MTDDAAAVRVRYLADRARIADRYGPQPLWHAVDAWPLYVGVGNLARALVLMRALEATRGVPGDVVEFGAWRGATTLLWAKLLLLWDAKGSARVHAFDTWDKGFEAEQWTAADAREVVGTYTGHYRGDMGVVLDMIQLYGLEERVRLHRGRIEETWSWVRPSILSISLVLLDVDLYEPTVAALEGLHERLSVGSVVLADEYGDPDWPGETKAIDEWLARYPDQYHTRAITEATQPTLWITRCA